MVILGLGSNVGDRLANLRKALRAIKQLSGFSVHQVSPVYISEALLPDNAPTEWDKPYLNLALRCETTLEPLDLLKQLKNIEWSIGRKPEVRHWGPRILDIDILALDDQIIQSDVLTVPHASLQDRPFALWPLADVAPLWKFPLPGPNHHKTAAEIVELWGSRFSGKALFHTKQINQRIDTPELVGILNITPDSFSDGGHFLTPDAALKQAVQLVNAGATVLDIGAESTNPRSTPIDPETEWQRLQPVLSALFENQQAFIIPPKISIDTYHAAVAKKALLAGVDWINDVTGLDNPAMREMLLHSKADCVVMHHLAIPERRTQVLSRGEDPIKAVYAWGYSRINELVREGFSLEKIIFDPGIGFGKMAEQSLILLNHLEAFESFNTRILIGHSRKTFLSLFSDQPFADRDIETMALTIYLSKQPVDYLRVHNVEMCARGLKVTAALGNK